MRGARRLKTILGFVGTLLCVCGPASAQTGKRLWVLTQPDMAIEYGLADFSPIQTVKIPPEAVKHPESFAINAKGQMLFVPGFTADRTVPDFSAGAMKVWFWNGRTASSLDQGATRKETPAGANASVEESVPQWALSADGQQLYRFANVFRRLEKRPDGGDVSVKTSFVAWQSDSTGAKPEQIAEFAFPQCSCETAVCSETCPEAEFWWPESGVGDFFIVTHRIEGQVSMTSQATYLYRKSQGKWSASRLPEALERVLDAAQGGGILVHSLPDGGCCGWDNESNDQTMLIRGGKSIVLFDERKRFENPDYDVSFFTSNAVLSPGAGYVAMTITSSLQSGMELRLADSGKPDAAELARIRQSLKDCPLAEILKTDDPPKRIALIPRATVAGWLNDREVLLIEEHVLVAFDITTGARRQSRVNVPGESLVFLR